MRRLIWTKTFVRALSKVIKRYPNTREDIGKTLRLLSADPFLPQLESHKLKGELSGSWACSVGYDLRIVFDFVKSSTGEDNILLLEIGSHEEVY